MTLPGTIVLRPNDDFSQPDYSVIYKDPDGPELTVGRIFSNHGLVGGERPWFWGVQFPLQRSVIWNREADARKPP